MKQWDSIADRPSVWRKAWHVAGHAMIAWDERLSSWSSVLCEPWAFVPDDGVEHGEGEPFRLASRNESVAEALEAGL